MAQSYRPPPEIPPAPGFERVGHLVQVETTVESVTVPGIGSVELVVIGSPVDSCVVVPEDERRLMFPEGGDA